MTAFRYGRFRLTGGDLPEMLVALRVTPSLFSVLRVNPVVGRGFSSDDGGPGRTDVVVLSHSLWQRQFGGDPTVVGRTLQLDGRGHLVLGVMPAGFNFPASLQSGALPPDLWAPLAADASRGSHNFRVIARLRTGHTIEQARADMDRLVRLVGDIDPGHRGRGGAVAGLQQRTVTSIRPALYILSGAIVLVLLIACANVASLLLARGAARQKETALRVALGAGRMRVLQQWLVESVLLALIGGAAGLLVGYAGVRLLAELAPALPLVKETTIDARVLAVTLLTTLTTGLVFGMAPAFQALRVEASDGLREAGCRQAGSASRTRTRTVLTIGELALALMLLIGAGLLVRSFVQLRNVDMGFDAEHMLTSSLDAPQDAAASPERTAAYFAEVVERIERISGVKAAAVASVAPFHSSDASPFRVEGGVSSDQREQIVYAQQPKVTPGYFRVMGIRLLRGRELNDQDIRTSQPVAVVSENLAAAEWPGEDAIGKRLSITDGQWRTVVGVVRDVRHEGPDRPVGPTIYIPQTQFSRPGLVLLVRTDSNPMSYVSQIQRAVAAVGQGQPLFRVQTMERALGESMSLRRFLMVLVVVFAILAALLGALGVYGVLAWFVRQRRQEIGVRLALGASRADVVWLVVRQGALVALAGIVPGLVGALALSSVLEGLLFGVQATDPWTFVLVPLLLMAVVLAASFLPACAAARVDPMISLRAE